MSGSRKILRVAQISRDAPTPGSGKTVDSGEVAALVGRIVAGERRAEEELVERFGRGLDLMLRRLVHNPAQAEDVRQETFRVVLEKARAGEIREPERLAGFLRGTARNLMISEARKQVRFGEPGGDAGTLMESRGAASAEAPQLRRVLRREEASQVRRLLSEMRFERDRQMLARFYLSDDGKEEICADLGVDPLRFKKVLHRARARLRELWERAEKRRDVANSADVVAARSA